MFELKISNLKEARHLSVQWATHMISLLDPDIKDYDFIKLPIISAERNLRRYYFDDITPNSFWCEYYPNAKFVTAEQIQDLLEFTTVLNSTDRLLVHCHAGISRSTAVALGVLCQHGFTPNEALKLVLSIRPQALPNQHILTLFDEILGLEGELVAKCQPMNKWV